MVDFTIRCDDGEQHYFKFEHLSDLYYRGWIPYRNPDLFWTKLDREGLDYNVSCNEDSIDGGNDEIQFYIDFTLRKQNKIQCFIEVHGWYNREDEPDIRNLMEALYS